MFCSKCKVVELNSRNKSGLCKPCYKKEWRSTPAAKEYQSEYFKTWRLDNIDKVKEHQLKHRYGISLEDYKNLEKLQNFQCKICLKTNKELNNNTKMFAVDHCHQTNKVRGLLCSNCNTAIGLLFESEENLKRAMDYLKENP